MRITSKISHYHKGVLALVLAPFLWLQMYFRAVEAWLTEIIYNQLFKSHQVVYGQLTHIVAYLCFSAFSLLAYYKQLDQYISLILYGVWLINYYSTQFKTGLYIDRPAWIRLETKEQYCEWNLLVKNQLQEQQKFAYSEIQCVLIAAVTYGDDSFKNQVLQVWHVQIQTKNGGEYVVYQDTEIQKAITKAFSLAQQLNTTVKIAQSYGTSSLAETELNIRNRRVVAWKRAFISDTVKIYKNFSTVSVFRWLRLIFAEISDFIFIAVLSGFMQRYGMLLLLLYGDNLGLTPPTMMEFTDSFSGSFSLLRPNFDWMLVLVFAITMLVLLHSIYKQSRQYEIVITAKKIHYRIAGQTKGSLNFSQRPDFILLKGFDKTSLIIVNEQHKVLEIKDLQEDEYNELYEMLLMA